MLSKLNNPFSPALSGSAQGAEEVGPVFSPEAQALFDEMIIPPTGELATAYNDFIDSLMTAGVWDKLEILYVAATVNPLDARLNLKDPSSSTTKAGVVGAGSPHSSTDGWATASTGAYMTMGIGLNFDQLPGWDGNNLCMAALSKGSLSSGNNVPWTAGSPSFAFLISLAPLGGARFRLRNAVSFDDFGSSLNVLIAVLRSNSTTIHYSKDGSDPGAGAPVVNNAGNDGDVVRMAWGADAAHFVRLVSFGGNLTAAELSAYNIAAKDLMTAIDV